MIRRAFTLFAAAALVVPASAAAAPADATPMVTKLVMFEPGTPAVVRSTLHTAAGAIVTGTLPEILVNRIEVPATGVALYERSPAVATIRGNRPYHLMGGVPNDPLIKLQWGLQQIGAFQAWGLETAFDRDQRRVQARFRQGDPAGPGVRRSSAT